MKIKFIGTGSGKTSLKRFHSSILITQNKFNLLIDAGEGISKALLIQGINYNSIDALLISHFHADHISGLNSVLTQMKITKREKPFQIYVHKKLSKMLIDIMGLGYIFYKTFDFKIEIIQFDSNSSITVSKKICFIAKQNTHVTNKYNVKTNLQFVSLSFLFSVNKKTLLYTSDVNDEKDILLFRDNEINTLIVESTHITIQQINKAIDELKPKYVYITHINDNDSELFNWHNKLTGIKRYHTKIASDGMEIII